MFPLLEDLWKNLPVVTKWYTTACVLTTLAVFLDLVNILDLYLNFELVGRGQVWRLFTNFFFYGKFGLGFIFHMVFLVRHSQLSEENSFRGRTADYLFMWIFGASILLFIDFMFWYTQIAANPLFLGPSLAFMVVYVWARRNPQVRMSFLGLFTFNAPYLPWVILGLEVLIDQGGSIFDVMGIAVGHLYYFLEDIYPRNTGRRFLKTPSILKQIFDAPPDVPIEVHQ
eukprot:TRINITY_DN7236_c0_g1_i2.p1 TRINITY_DN7236_c0_g1~~TRINITY_DN7236_c0_g1_i2.p1  ORF type:complete len:242 (-),score=40.70 TRINITY_DN7236_c0_g1_i2:71-751(-)